MYVGCMTELTEVHYKYEPFVAALVGQFCWWEGFIVFCGERTKRMAKMDMTMINIKDKKILRRKSSWSSALHITENDEEDGMV